MPKALQPDDPIPELSLPLISGDRYTPGADAPANFSLLIFYRGLHCSLCKAQLQDLNVRTGDFAALGVSCVAISMDQKDRAEKAREAWDIPNVPVAYGLDKAQAQHWGLYLSKGMWEQEPTLFCEPAMFLVRPDNRLYAAYLQSVPFGRPGFDDLFNGIKFVVERDYPARGTGSK